MCEGRGFKVRGKASTPSKNSLKGGKKEVTSWEANEINNNSKESKADSTGMAKGRARSIFLVRGRGRGLQRSEGKAQRGKNGEEGNQHPWNSERRSKQQK